MNKRGDLVWTLIFFVALFLISGSLYAMVSFGGNMKGNSKEISEIIGELEFAEKYIIKSAEVIGSEMIRECKGKCPEEKAGEIIKKYDLYEKKVIIESLGNFFGKMRNKEYSFDKKDKGFIFEVSGLFVKSARGKNELARNFELMVCFDNEGNVVGC